MRLQQEVKQQRFSNSRHFQSVPSGSKSSSSEGEEEIGIMDSEIAIFIPKNDVSIRMTVNASLLSSPVQNNVGTWAHMGEGELCDFSVTNFYDC